MWNFSDINFVSLIVLKFAGVSSKHLRIFLESLRNLRKSSDILGNFRKFTENVRKRSSRCRNNFGKSSEIFGKWSEIFGKSSKTPSSVSLNNKQNNTWTLGDMEFILSCSHSISHSFAALTRSISMWTLEDKFHISAWPCIILYIKDSNIESLNSKHYMKYKIQGRHFWKGMCLVCF